MSCILMGLNVRSNRLKWEMKSLLVCSNFLLRRLILIFIPKGTRKEEEEEKAEIVSIPSGIPGARAKQTAQINCFSDTGARSIKANQITSLSSGPAKWLICRFNNKLGRGLLQIISRRLECADWKREAYKIRGRGGAETCVVVLTGSQKTGLIENDQAPSQKPIKSGFFVEKAQFSDMIVSVAAVFRLDKQI